MHGIPSDITFWISESNYEFFFYGCFMQILFSLNLLLILCRIIICSELNLLEKLTSTNVFNGHCI